MEGMEKAALSTFTMNTAAVMSPHESVMMSVSR